MRWRAVVTAAIWLANAGMVHAQEVTSAQVRPGSPSPVRFLDASTPPAVRLQMNTEGKGENGNGEKKAEEPPEHIKDNSFLVEEAYNQEAGVVQHIFNWVQFWDREPGVKSREFTFLYIMELPICSQTHQFSFALPFQKLYERDDGLLPEEEGGFGDVFFNYRYQLSTEDACSWRPAVAPRFSLIAPTGDEDRGLGQGELGYQFNLPISKELDPFAFHFNAGYTYVPGVSVLLADGPPSPGRDLHSYNLGASAIWLVNYDFNLVLELVAYWNDELDELGNHDRTFELILNPGFRYAVYTGEEVQWVLGASVPIGLSKEAPDIGVFGYMSVEHRFLKKQNSNSE